MSDDKKNLDENGNPIEGDQTSAGDGKSKDEGDASKKDGGDNQPTIESLQADLAKKDATIENLKGTQSATSKNLAEMQKQMDSHKESFEKAGIDATGLTSLVESQNRNSILIEVAAEKNLSVNDFEFIQGKTKEEITASVDKFQKSIDDKLESVKSTQDTPPVKKEIPKNNQKGGDKKPENEDDQVTEALEQRKLIKPKK